MRRVVSVVLGGGRGTRLMPLTTHRAKPAVPLAGRYRLIDIPLSNCINSGMKDICVLTQFMSASLNQHIATSYRFDRFTKGRLEVLAAEQFTASGDEDWYQGTADAVRKQLHRIARPEIDGVLILGGDHLYRMDYRDLVETHEQTKADVTIAGIALPRRELTGFGVIGVGGDQLVTGFTEKPDPGDDVEHLRLPTDLRTGDGKDFLASMGVYLFSRDALLQVLEGPGIDFGKDILPSMLSTHRVAAHRFDGYWEDIGTISAFYEANLALATSPSPFRFYEPRAPVYTRARFLPPSVVRNAQMRDVLLAEGCLVYGSTIEHSVVGIRSVLSDGVTVKDSVVMGADFFEDRAARAENARTGRIDIGLGKGTVVERAIIDKNARIGEGCVIRGEPGRPDEHTKNWSVVDGIAIVPKNAELPPGTVI